MIDLRSDTLTKPTKAMYEAISEAELGDEGRLTDDNRGGDPTIRLLEDKAAEITGMESALFCVSGTMGNLLALITYTNYGDYCAANEYLHVCKSEKGIFAERPGGIKPLYYKTDSLGSPDISSIDKLLKDSRVKALCIENTNNFYGGTCLSPDYMAEISRTVKKHNVPVHMDGARLFNASVALNTDVREFTKHTDSVMFCISKGLGAPMGSLLCSSRDFISKARTNKKYLGGVLRQGGIAAAAGIVALETGPQQLKADHKNAKALAVELSGIKSLKIDMKSVQTNILKVDVSETGMDAETFSSELRKLGVLVNAVDKNCIRAVLYRGISSEMTAEAAGIFRKLAN